MRTGHRPQDCPQHRFPLRARGSAEKPDPGNFARRISAGFPVAGGAPAIRADWVAGWGLYDRAVEALGHEGITDPGILAALARVRFGRRTPRTPGIGASARHLAHGVDDRELAHRE